MDPRPQPDIDFTRAVSFVFHGRSWGRRMLIGGAVVGLCAAGIGIPILLGSMKRVFRDAVQDDVPELPGWSPRRDVGEGLTVLAVLVVYAVPGVAFAQLPLVGGKLSMLYGALAVFLLPAALTHLFVMQALPAAFDFDWILSYIADNLGHYVVLILFLMMALCAATAGLIAFGVGILLTAFWALMSSMHLMAQVYRLSRLHGTPAPVGAAGEPAAMAT